jgi:hypothetical protein
LEQTLQVIQKLKAAGWVCYPETTEEAESPRECYSVKLRHGYNRGGKTERVEQWLWDALEGRIRELWGREMVLEWDISNDVEEPLPNARFPFGAMTYEGDGWDYQLAVLWSPDILTQSGESFASMDGGICENGHEVAVNEPFELRRSPSNRIFDRIYGKCPECGAKVTVTESIEAKTPDMQKVTLPGGVSFRFGIVVDAGRSLPETPIELHPEFIHILESTLGVPFREMGTYY